MSAPDWLGLGAALLTLLTVAELLRRGILRERFAALWLAVAVVLVFLAVFPQALRWAADLLGFQVPANLLFFGSILFLLVVAAQLSSEISGPRGPHPPPRRGGRPARRGGPAALLAPGQRHHPVRQ